MKENKIKKKRYLLTLASVVIFSFTAFYWGHSSILKKVQVYNQVESKQNVVTEQTANNQTISATWKTYTNERMGITFQYPETWTKNGDESDAINRKGEVMSINISFIDTTSQSIFNMVYHLPPYGAEVYKLAEDQYYSSINSNERNTKLNTVAGNNAVESFTTMSKDIKGGIYDPALKLIHIVFLDKQKTGAFNLNFRTPSTASEVEIAKFNQLLSTFKFTN